MRCRISTGSKRETSRLNPGVRCPQRRCSQTENALSAGLGREGVLYARYRQIQRLTQHVPRQAERESRRGGPLVDVVKPLTAYLRRVKLMTAELDTAVQGPGVGDVVLDAAADRKSASSDGWAMRAFV